MRVNSAKHVTPVSKAVVEIEDGAVILSLREYRRLLENSVPALYLRGRRARALDRLVTEGLQEHLRGRTRKINSLADLDQ
jgi:hypothetical protein